MDKETRLHEGGGGNALNTLQKSAFTQEQLTELIKRTYNRLIKLDNELEKNKHHGAVFFKDIDAVNKLGSLLLKYLELAGINFSGNVLQEHIFDLLQKLDSETRKNVEEIIKNERKQHT